MTDEHRDIHCATNQVGELSTNMRPVLKERLADLEQLLETNPALSSTGLAHVEVYEVRVSIIASERDSFSFPGCFPQSSDVRYVGGAPRSQRPH
jgi:hypothetical protein